MSFQTTPLRRQRAGAAALPRTLTRGAGAIAAVALMLLHAQPAGAQTGRDTVMRPHQATMDTAAIQPTIATARTGDATLDRLVSLAVERNPQAAAARARRASAEARVRPAGTRPDPILSAGLIMIPIAKPSLIDDDFTMLMVGVQQSFPASGKRSLRTRAATLDVESALSAVTASELDVARAVKDAWFEIAYLDRALLVARRHGTVLGDLIQVAEAQYGSGSATQQDVLAARIDAARLGETANALLEARRGSVAQLNASLDRPSDVPVEEVTLPSRIVRASIASDPASIRFGAATLGARAADSPLPSLATLQELAERNSPMLRGHAYRIEAQRARVELAQRESRPDVDVMLQYNHRPAYPDLVTAQVSFPLRLQKSARQHEAVRESSAELSALVAEHRAEVNLVRAQIATLVSEAEHHRTQLALYVKAILPQAQAGATSAAASFQAGRADLRMLLQQQAAVFVHETAYFRAQSDFAKKIAELEQVIGAEVLP